MVTVLKKSKAEPGSPFDGVRSEDVSRYIGTVRQIAGWRRGCMTMEDAYAVGLEGAALALGSYNASLGVPESAWVRLKVRWAIDSARKKEADAAAREIAVRTEGMTVSDADPVGDMLDGMPVRTREIVRRVAVIGERQADVARCLGISRQRVGVIYHRALGKLRERAEGE